MSDEEAQKEALAVKCPFCNALPERTCRNRRGEPQVPHKARVEAAERQRHQKEQEGKQGEPDDEDAQGEPDDEEARQATIAPRRGHAMPARPPAPPPAQRESPEEDDEDDTPKRGRPRK